jgi:hypothetical protein
MADEKIQASPPKFEPVFYTELSKKAKKNHRTIAAEIERLTILGFEIEELLKSK